MIRLRRRQIRQGPIDWSGGTVTLIGAETTASMTTRWFAWAATARRPVRVEFSDPATAPISIRDPVMLVRTAAFALSVAAVARRLLR